MWFGKIKTYTAEDVHNELFLLSIMLIKKIEEEREKQALQVPQKLEEEYNALCKMGLGKSQNALLIKKKLDAIYSLNLTISDHNSQVEYFRRVARFVREVRAYFKNAIVVSAQDFLTLLEKYNLICGDLSDYTGAIPEENIQELKEARITKPDKPLDAYDTLMKYYSEYKYVAEPYFKMLGLWRG